MIDRNRKEPSVKQELFLAAYMQSGNMTESATRAGVSVSQVRRWIRAGLDGVISERKRKVVDATIGKLQTSMMEALDFLLQVLNTDNLSVSERMKAAELILRGGLKAYETSGLVQLADLQNKLEEITNE